MGSIHLIRFKDHEAGVRAIGAWRAVRVNRVRFPGDIHGVTNEHISALKKAKIPFLYVSKEPSCRDADPDHVIVTP
jgi:hypothetical protein